MLDPNWTAPKIGNDWRDNELLLSVAWLKSFVPTREMESRIDNAKSYLLEARRKMREGFPAPLYDPADTAAWYILQAETFATDKRYWTPEGVAQAVPCLTRLAKELKSLLGVRGVEERAARLMLSERRQPDSGLFELLVALAYRRHGWQRVEFVDETPGLGQTPDLHVFRERSRWAVECKRLRPSPYAEQEKVLGQKLAAPVHALCLEAGVSLILKVTFKTELKNVPETYLRQLAENAITTGQFAIWDDDTSEGSIRPIDWRLIRRVMASDKVYFGSSRMIELLTGYYDHDAGHSMSAKWRPDNNKPEYADTVYQASVVSWLSQSDEAMEQKSRHFKKTIANAETQLPSDRPGVIHVGIESTAGAGVDFWRHMSNAFIARLFETKNSRLRWVYGNYFVPELTTRKDESWAITETTVPYKIGRHGTKWPLTGHMLISPEKTGRPGMHWDGLVEKRAP